MSLSKALELVNSRIEYNQSLCEFLADASDADYDCFKSEILQPFNALKSYLARTRPNDVLQAGVVDRISHKKVTDIRLKLLFDLQKLLIHALAPDYDGDLLELVFFINLAFENENKSIQTYRASFENSISCLSQEIKKLKKNNSLNEQLLKVQAEQANLDTMYKLLMDNLDDHCEYNLYSSLYEILNGADILSKMERDFYPKNYRAIQSPGAKCIDRYSPTNKMKELQSECIRRVASTSAKITNAKINDFDSDRYFRQISVFNGLVTIIKQKPELDGTRGMLSFYRMIYDVKENFGSIEALVDQHLKQLHELQKQQEKIRKAAEAEQKRQLNELKKQEAIKLAEIAKLQEQQALAEKTQKAEFEKQLEELNKKQRADIDAQKKLQQIEAKQLKQQKKQEKELEKSKRKREQFMVELNEDKVAVDENEDAISKPKFTIDPNLIEANIAKLEELFDYNTSSFKFSDATTLINRLNGEIVGSAGSHKYIQFNDVIVTSVRISRESQKFGLAKPHIPELRHNNLTLLRKAIWAVLPEDCALKQSWAPPVRGHLKLKP